MSQNLGQQRCFSGEVQVSFRTKMTKGKILTLHLTEPGLLQCTTKRQARQVSRSTARKLLRKMYGNKFSFAEIKPEEIPLNA